MSIDEKAFREQQERLMAENAQLRDEVKRLRGPFTCKHDPQYVGGACAACHAEWIDRAQRAELQLSEAVELLRQANDLYTGYGLICGPIKDFPKYEGTVHQGEWIGKVRAIVRASKKPVGGLPISLGCCQVCLQDSCICLKRKDEAPKFEFCRHAFNIGMNCIREKGHGGPCR